METSVDKYFLNKKGVFNFDLFNYLIYLDIYKIDNYSDNIKLYNELINKNFDTSYGFTELQIMPVLLNSINGSLD